MKSYCYGEDLDHYRCYAGNSFGGNIEGNDSEIMIINDNDDNGDNGDNDDNDQDKSRGAVVLVITCQCEVLGREGLPKKNINNDIIKIKQ